MMLIIALAEPAVESLKPLQEAKTKAESFSVESKSVTNRCNINKKCSRLFHKKNINVKNNATKRKSHKRTKRFTDQFY